MRPRSSAVIDYPLYEKVGRRYHPVEQYIRTDGFVEGDYLLTVRPGHRTLVSMGKTPTSERKTAVFKHRLTSALATALCQATQMRPVRQPLTEAEAAAWDTFAKAAPAIANSLTMGSACECAMKAVDAALRDKEIPVLPATSWRSLK